MGFFGGTGGGASINKLGDVNDVHEYTAQWVPRSYTPSLVTDTYTLEQMFGASPSLVAGSGAPVGDVGGEAVEIDQYYFDYTNERLYVITTFEYVPGEDEEDPGYYNIVWTEITDLIVLTATPVDEDGAVGDFCVVKLEDFSPTRYVVYGPKYIGPVPYRPLAFLPSWWYGNQSATSAWFASSLFDINAVSVPQFNNELKNFSKNKFGKQDPWADAIVADGFVNVNIGEANVFRAFIDADATLTIEGIDIGIANTTREFRLLLEIFPADVTAVTLTLPGGSLWMGNSIDASGDPGDVTTYILSFLSFDNGDTWYVTEQGKNVTTI